MQIKKEEEIVQTQIIESDEEIGCLNYKVNQIKGFKSNAKTIASIQRQHSIQPQLRINSHVQQEIKGIILSKQVQGQQIKSNSTILNNKTLTISQQFQEDSTLQKKNINVPSNNSAINHHSFKNTPKVKSKSKNRVRSKNKEQAKPRFQFFQKKLNNNNKHGNNIFQNAITQLSEINGEGMITTSNGKIIQGVFCQGMPIGNVKMIFQNHAVYIGPLYDFLPHGKGVMKYPGGQKYDGQFVYGQPHGEGLFYDEKGQLKHQGEWKRGKFYR